MAALLGLVLAGCGKAEYEERLDQTVRKLNTPPAPAAPAEGQGGEKPADAPAS